jgi:hypothetical protein
VVIRSTDMLGNSYDKTLTIAVGDLNEAPSSLNMSLCPFAENASGDLKECP